MRDHCDVYWTILNILVPVGTPTGDNFSLKRKNRLLGVLDWNFSLRVISGYFEIFRLIRLNLNLNLVRSQARARTQELLGHPDAYRILFSSDRS
jgi:hypothetical protein